MAIEPADEGTHKGQDYSQYKTFFKYCSDDERVLKGIFEDHKIRFTQPAALNDPLEFNPIIRFEDDADNYRSFVLNGMVFPSEELRLRTGLIESQVNTFGILSLTKIPDSFDMWSRYANGHRGLLLELKAESNKHTCMLSRSGLEYPVREVAYVEEYALDIPEIIDEGGWIAQQAVNEKMFFTKTSRWEHEREYRLVRELADYPGWQPLDNRRHRDLEVYLFDFSLDCIESVTFGACMPVDKKKRIIDACKRTDIAFLQSLIVRDRKDRLGGQGNVELISIEAFSNFLEMADFITEEQYIEVRKKPIVINELNELPYYADDLEFVRQYIQNRKERQTRRRGC
ncbi:MAG: DUF2971 domain-containing protein [Planctomycetes bacterium]|nr:DUF2971 domain-containing protein [Planctomycetota bacterium]